MTPREFAEHVDMESARIAGMLDGIAHSALSRGAPVALSAKAADDALSELNRLARQHAIEQEQNG